VYTHLPKPFSQLPSLHPVLLAKTDEQIKKLKNIIREYFFINIFYTKFLKKKSPPTMLGEILNFNFYP
jgi:hypothetical protein